MQQKGDTALKLSLTPSLVCSTFCQRSMNTGPDGCADKSLAMPSILTQPLLNGAILVRFPTKEQPAGLCQPVAHGFYVTDFL